MKHPCGGEAFISDLHFYISLDEKTIAGLNLKDKKDRQVAEMIKEQLQFILDNRGNKRVILFQGVGVQGKKKKRK